ncbi:septation ring formation regulator EzrA [Streptococcus massiliensis]|uniref:Septation ring formation regulator EzrA n=1 Tax=Streptococcus massiliensis TaxID=313439 RepID=A0A380KWD8_9STRE|nr:septation ring formation regulator EzrA [Streptococcus massiliensis]SUN76242.1 septation ring formation regulator EzrA [Streptococcus massiliensis]
MSSGLIILIIVVAVLILLAYVVAIFLRRRNAQLLADLEDKKEKLYNLPVNDEIEAIKNMHLIGQSQVTFREWNQKWVDLSLNSFADIENNLFEAEGYNNAFRFLKAKHEIDNIESQVHLVEEDIKAIRTALEELEEKEAQNSGRVHHALDLFDSLQKNVEQSPEIYGQALAEIEQQMKHIQDDFSKFVTLNSSGDPIEASDILNKIEDYILALTQIVEKVPVLVEKIDKDFPDQLEDLESGYRRLLEEDYHFFETDIESRFYQLRRRLKANNEIIAALELDNAQYENDQIQEELDALYALFNREIEAKSVVVKLRSTLPKYVEHTGENNRHLVSEVDRLTKSYYLSDSVATQIKSLQSDFKNIEDEVFSWDSESKPSEQPFSEQEENLKEIQEQLKNIEDIQLDLGESLTKIEKDDANARQKANIYVNKLHTIKRYLEKRNLPGIPENFLTQFFNASNNAEELLDELEQHRVNIETVNRLLEIVTHDMLELEELTYQIVQNATLTEQLLQYSNRYRSFDEGVQAAFNRSLDIFEHQFDYVASFEEISQALDVVEPGVTERFVTSYEKTRENIRF